MKAIKKLRATIVAILMLVITSGAAFAQQTTTPQAQPQQQAKQNFTDAEVKQFADANMRLMAIQKESETKMMGILQEEKISPEKFNEMAQAHQQQKLSEVKATPEELAAFNKSAQRIVEMQPTLQQQAEEAIAKDGMTMEKYQMMVTAYQQDPSLQEKVNKLMGQQ